MCCHVCSCKTLLKGPEDRPNKVPTGHNDKTNGVPSFRPGSAAPNPLPPPPPQGISSQATTIPGMLPDW